MAKRRYTLKRRAEKQEATRDRIVEATMALHEEVGPRDTTIRAIAERAGVQRLTVYRHFPDDGSLFTACTTRWLELNPPPDPASWQHLEDAEVRTECALLALDAYYRRTKRMWIVAYRDVELVEALQAPMHAFEAYLDGVRDDLTAAWGPAPSAANWLRVSIRHCVRFSTWQALDRDGMADHEKAQLMLRWVKAVACWGGARDSRRARPEP